MIGDGRGREKGVWWEIGFSEIVSSKGGFC